MWLVATLLDSTSTAHRRTNLHVAMSAVLKAQLCHQLASFPDPRKNKIRPEQVFLQNIMLSMSWPQRQLIPLICLLFSLLVVGSPPENAQGVWGHSIWHTVVSLLTYILIAAEQNLAFPTAYHGKLIHNIQNVLRKCLLVFFFFNQEEKTKGFITI